MQEKVTATYRQVMRMVLILLVILLRCRVVVLPCSLAVDSWILFRVVRVLRGAVGPLDQLPLVRSRGKVLVRCCHA